MASAGFERLPLDCDVLIDQTHPRISVDAAGSFLGRHDEAPTVQLGLVGCDGRSGEFADKLDAAFGADDDLMVSYAAILQRRHVNAL
jgi:hypothetical protein